MYFWFCLVYITPPDKHSARGLLSKWYDLLCVWRSHSRLHVGIRLLEALSYCVQGGRSNSPSAGMPVMSTAPPPSSIEVIIPLSGCADPGIWGGQPQVPTFLPEQKDLLPEGGETCADSLVFVCLFGFFFFAYLCVCVGRECMCVCFCVCATVNPPLAVMI